jgi:hypothetical protein
LRGATLDVVPCRLVMAKPHDGDDVGALFAARSPTRFSR